jgi:hypothetical protein
VLRFMVQKIHSSRSVGKSSPSEEFLDQTIEVWQPHSERTLTREDAREIITNVVGFFQVLKEWDREDIRSNRNPMHEKLFVLKQTITFTNAGT